MYRPAAHQNQLLGKTSPGHHSGNGQLLHQSTVVLCTDQRHSWPQNPEHHATRASQNLSDSCLGMTKQPAVVYNADDDGESAPDAPKIAGHAENL